MIAAIFLMAQATSPQPDVEATRSAAVSSAYREIEASNPGKAISILDPVIAAVEADAARTPGKTYCGMSLAETLAYMSMAAQAKTAGVAIGRSYCDALFLKGYSLIDLGRLAEARSYLEKAISFAPMHAHFIVELGQSYRAERNWPKMLELCRSAVFYADLAGDEFKVTDKGLALRCVGYALVEQGKWDEAAAQYRECLKINPNDTKARGELQYIAEQREKRT